MFKSLAKVFEDLPTVVLLILVILFDGLIGGVIRIGKGKQTTSKAVGWILLISFIFSLIGGLLPGLPSIVTVIIRIVYIVCLIIDVITVATKGKITFMAD